MTSNARPDTRVLGSLRSAGGAGVVRIEDRYDTDIDDLWSAVTEPERLVRWWGRVEGDLRPGGQLRLFVESAGLESTGHVAACEPPRHFRVTSRESDESWAAGSPDAPPPFDSVIDVTLTPAGDQTTLVIEVSGLPLDRIASYGAGWQIHAENLATHLTGANLDRTDEPARWTHLVPTYQSQAAHLR
jgi:uncharacterized protein YndB with AHSA1/START domain